MTNELRTNVFILLYKLWRTMLYSALISIFHHYCCVVRGKPTKISTLGDLKITSLVIGIYNLTGEGGAAAAATTTTTTTTPGQRQTSLGLKIF